MFKKVSDFFKNVSSVCDLNCDYTCERCRPQKKVSGGIPPIPNYAPAKEEIRFQESGEYKAMMKRIETLERADVIGTSIGNTCAEILRIQDREIAKLIKSLKQITVVALLLGLSQIIELTFQLLN